MSHYKPYPAYRDSGVEWIGQVPEHWARASIKHILATPITDGPHETPVFINEGIEFLSVDGIQDGELVFEGKRYISYEDHARFCKKAKPQLNDVLVGKSASVGKVARVKTSNDFNVWSPLAILRSDTNKCAPVYLEFALKADTAQQQILLAGNTSTQANIGMDRLASVGIPLPPVSEQIQLTKVVDQENARIDALIAKKTRFIELLKEKRHALIDHAVTKGLNSEAPIRKSGVEWLGEIPAHWEVRRMASIFREAIRPGDPALPILSISIHDGITDDEVAPEDRDRRVSQIEDRTKYKRVAPNDLAYNMMRAWQGAFGAVTVDGLVSPAYVVAEPTAAFRTAYIENLLRTPMAIEEMRRYSRGIADFRMRLYWDYFRDLKVCLPPLEEQDKILSMINRETSRIDLLTGKTQRSIDLLKERRAAFITAAVTGQIDLRETA